MFHSKHDQETRKHSDNAWLHGTRVNTYGVVDLVMTRQSLTGTLSNSTTASTGEFPIQLLQKKSVYTVEFRALRPFLLVPSIETNAWPRPAQKAATNKYIHTNSTYISRK